MFKPIKWIIYLFLLQQPELFFLLFSFLPAKPEWVAFAPHSLRLLATSRFSRTVSRIQNTAPFPIRTTITGRPRRTLDDNLFRFGLGRRHQFPPPKERREWLCRPPSRTAPTPAPVGRGWDATSSSRKCLQAITFLSRCAQEEWAVPPPQCSPWPGGTGSPQTEQTEHKTGSKFRLRVISPPLGVSYRRWI